MKSAPFYLLLTLLATPAMAGNIFSGIIDFGRDVLDETRKLAPGIQNDKRNEAPSRVAATAPDDGRDSPALDGSATNNATVVIAPPLAASQPAPPSTNHGWQFVEEDHLNGNNP
ncbi:hypothetical protein [Oceanisphaera arctica]|uniref:Uncharacterized protein n=1 Tax=Oceanisphaera arctica TaxID=641510 RepID=A0A2P5TLB7_9GAMM|nr:hypothetical protein [Oceanisphaera arctica]PPL16090.1 hypothetical protein UN63_10215 [Oceanisphaera arctica]GHA26423.1 hypothetical protein GCM10007082_28600 [Oceanisphaera arctica]